jgi:guanylate kinase
MENQLHRLQEFQQILQNYQISEASKQILTKTKLALMVGPTSCGRNTIIKHLVNQGGYRFLVSDTTRAKRANDGIMEQDGVEYWFRTEDEVLADLKTGRFLEAAIIHAQQVSGVSIKELERTIAADMVGITDIEIIGVDTIKELHPKADAFFVLPPSFEEWQRRLHHRGAMTQSEKRRRMESAVHEFSHALEVGFYHFIINDSIEGAAQRVADVTAGKTNKNAEKQARQLAIELLTETQYWLAKN